MDNGTAPKQIVMVMPPIVGARGRMQWNEIIVLAQTRRQKRETSRDR